MMFKEWCLKKFGITKISEGKILNLKLISYANNPYLKNFQDLLKNLYNARAVYKEGQCIGYSISAINYELFAETLKTQHHLNVKSEEYKLPAPLLFKILDGKNKEFLKLFALFSPQREFDPISKEFRYRINSNALDELYRQYNLEKKDTKSIMEFQSQLKNFNQMKQQIVANNLTDYMDKAHTLSLDYTNSGRVNCTIYEASSAYAMSLRIFAELHKDALTKIQYLVLKHATEMLASYDKDNNLQQGLKSDSNFIHHLNKNLVTGRKKNDGSLQLITELSNYSLIRKMIDDNTHNLLYGKKKVSLGKHKTFNMRRFLPDAQMKSETHELILQTGGMINHSAMARIIKVGMLNNGTRARKGTKPNYFNYFKVETNLGAGCHDVNWSDKTCTGTFITQLQPTYNHNGKIRTSKVNPVTNSNEYQNQMEHTLTELIKVERELQFYRKPQTGPNGEGASPANSDEAHEWSRLNARREQLKGTAFSGQVDFISINANGEEISTWVHNQRGYLQEGGSCPIFSIKQLVTSIIGIELASLHSQFLQKHDGAQHLHLVEEKISSINLQEQELIQQVLKSEQYDSYIYDLLQNTLVNKKDKLSQGMLNDLQTLSKFCNAKLKLAQLNNFDDHYKISVKEFYKKAIDIRLSDFSYEQQVDQMKSMAHTEFSHRHSTLRLLTDIITMIGTLFFMGIGRVLAGHSFFWSTASTARESEFVSLIQTSQSDSLLGVWKK